MEGCGVTVSFSNDVTVIRKQKLQRGPNNTWVLQPWNKISKAMTASCNVVVMGLETGSPDPPLGFLSPFLLPVPIC